MEHYTVWFDGAKEFSVVNTRTNTPAVGENGKPLTGLSYREAMQLHEKLNQFHFE
jgi:hypothetical protein